MLYHRPCLGIVIGDSQGLGPLKALNRSRAGPERGQSPTQTCRSLPSPNNSADLSGFFKNLEKIKRIENGLNKRFCYEDRRTDKKVLPSKSHVINRQKIYGISLKLYFLQ